MAWWIEVYRLIRSIDHSWVPISSIPIDRLYIAHLLPVSSYLSGSKINCFSHTARLSDPDTMTITTLKAIASSSDNNINLHVSRNATKHPEKTKHEVATMTFDCYLLTIILKTLIFTYLVFTNLKP